MIAIVTETLSCLNEADCTAFGVSLAPMTCVVGDMICRDRILSSAADEPLDPTGHTAPPTEAAYYTHFEALLTQYDGIICITASGKFSESNRHATRAAARLGGRVTVVDGYTVAGGLLLLVLRARHLVSLGYPISRIKAELSAYRNTLRVSFTANSTVALARAGKLSFQMPIGELGPQERPVFRIQRGGIRVATYVSGEERIMDEMLTVLETPSGADWRTPSHVVVHYATRTQAVAYLVRRIGELYPSATVYERPITLSLQLNLGHDIVGLIGD